MANTIKKILQRIPGYKAILTYTNNSFKKKVFREQFQKFKAASNQDRFAVNWNDCIPYLNDSTASTAFDRHYIYHTAWAARILSQTQPKEHIDISSSLFFNVITSAFIPIKFFDYRPAQLGLDNIQSNHADLLKLPFKDSTIPSLSCMHVVEHIGLGRYGDPINPDDDLIAIAELKRVLALNGDLLFAVPIGQPKLIFNAQRVYSFEQIMNYFSDLTLQEFSLIPDSPDTGGLIRNASKEAADMQTNGCGCFWFKKDN